MKTRIALATLALAAAPSLAAPALAQEAGPGSHTQATTIGPSTEKSAKTGSVIPVLRADYNRSGTVDVQDVFDFLSGWFAASPDCDINGNGYLDGLDILEFINLWLAAPTVTIESAG
ncbi:MAG TPA: GC-type dockerin domain-anchored protein [Phycisphaerales bacterium]|jgi:hypothetical protein|nr:GC-type dockerin domain-anchored protein [Phycisphaerales bacterium]